MSDQPAPEIPQTSLASRADSAGLVTLYFLRWTAYGNAAYQKGQSAGFSPREARDILSIDPPAAVLVQNGLAGPPGALRRGF